MGFLLSDGERARLRYIQAMRRCLMRFADVLRYEQPELPELLRRAQLRATPQDRELTRLLHDCADRLERSVNPQLMQLFAGAAQRVPGYGVLSAQERSAFEHLLGELGRTGLAQQLQLISAADEQLRRHEEQAARESAQRVRLIRTLGLTAGAAVFLLLI